MRGKEDPLWRSSLCRAHCHWGRRVTAIAPASLPSDSTGTGPVYNNKASINRHHTRGSSDKDEGLTITGPRVLPWAHR